MFLGPDSGTYLWEDATLTYTETISVLWDLKTHLVHTIAFYAMSATSRLAYIESLLSPARHTLIFLGP